MSSACGVAVGFVGGAFHQDITPLSTLDIRLAGVLFVLFVIVFVSSYALTAWAQYVSAGDAAAAQRATADALGGTLSKLDGKVSELGVTSASVDTGVAVLREQTLELRSLTHELLTVPPRAATEAVARWGGQAVRASRAAAVVVTEYRVAASGAGIAAHGTQARALASRRLQAIGLISALLRQQLEALNRAERAINPEPTGETDSVHEHVVVWSFIERESVTDQAVLQSIADWYPGFTAEHVIGWLQFENSESLYSTPAAPSTTDVPAARLPGLAVPLLEQQNLHLPGLAPMAAATRKLAVFSGRSDYARLVEASDTNQPVANELGKHIAEMLKLSSFEPNAGQAYHSASYPLLVEQPTATDTPPTTRLVGVVELVRLGLRPDIRRYAPLSRGILEPILVGLGETYASARYLNRKTVAA